jgi:hypothetical protein
MTTRTLAGRLARIEGDPTNAAWRPWAGRPLREWPLAALHLALVASHAGDAEATAATAHFRADDLEALAAELEALA